MGVWNVHDGMQLMGMAQCQRPQGRGARGRGDKKRGYGAGGEAFSDKIKRAGWWRRKGCTKKRGSRWVAAREPVRQSRGGEERVRVVVVVEGKEQNEDLGSITAIMERRAQQQSEISDNENPLRG